MPKSDMPESTVLIAQGMSCFCLMKIDLSFQSLEWRKDGQKLSKAGSSGYSVISEGRLLILLGLQPEHNGDYECTARNDAGEVSRK